jgi:hypothetical protein
LPLGSCVGAGVGLEMAELEYPDIADKINYCIDVILKEAKLEGRLVRQIFYTMLSAYTNNPLNLAINSPSGEGKNYVLRKVAENFPKEDVMFLTGMTDKALFHRSGKLVIKNISGEYEDIEEQIKDYDSRIEDLQSELATANNNIQKSAIKAEIKRLEEEKADLHKDAKKLIDISHKILIILDTPRFGLFDALMSLLSHDNYEVEYEYADTTSTGIKTKTNVLRGWPVMIFAQALDFTHYQRYPEIKRRFNITNPKMDKDKYKAAIDLIGKKFSFPNFMYESEVISKSEKEKVRDIIQGLKDRILNICDAIEPGDNNVIVPYQEHIIKALRSDKAHDMTVAYRLFSYLSLLPAINIEKRPRVIFRDKRQPIEQGKPLTQIMPLATYDDLKEAMSLMEYANGVRPYILEWYHKVFLPTFEAKTEPDSKLVKKDDLRTEDRIALTTEDLVIATKNVQEKTLPVKKILQTYLEPLMNEGYIDKQESNINHRSNIYYPILSDSEASLFQIFKGQKRNKEQENREQDFLDFTREISEEYIKERIQKIVSCSSGDGVFCEISDCNGSNITIDELVEKYCNTDPPSALSAPLTGADTPPNDPPLPSSEHVQENCTPCNSIQEENSENDLPSEEQEKEPEPSSVDQTEAIDIPLGENGIREQEMIPKSLYKLKGSKCVWKCSDCFQNGDKQSMIDHVEHCSHDKDLDTTEVI